MSTRESTYPIKYVDVTADVLRSFDPELDKLIPICQAVDLLGVSRATLYRLAARGGLPLYRVGDQRNQSRLSLRDVLALMVPVDVSTGSTAHPVDKDNRAHGTTQLRQREAIAERARKRRATRATVTAKAHATPPNQYPGRGPWPRTTCPQCGDRAAYSPKNGRISAHPGTCDVGHKLTQTAVFVPLDDHATKDINR